MLTLRRVRRWFVASGPPLDLRFGFVLLEPVTLLDLADQLLFFSLDTLEVLIVELRPFLFDMIRDLMPLFLDLIPIHLFRLSFLPNLIFPEDAGSRFFSIGIFRAATNS